MTPKVYDVNTAATFFRAEEWTMLGAHAMILLVSGVVEAIVCVPLRAQPLRFVLSFLRLNLFRDFFWVFARPTYTTLHPQFAQVRVRARERC